MKNLLKPASGNLISFTLRWTCFGAAVVGVVIANSRVLDLLFLSCVIGGTVAATIWLLIITKP